MNAEAKEIAEEGGEAEALDTDLDEDLFQDMLVALLDEGFIKMADSMVWLTKKGELHYEKLKGIASEAE